MPKKLKLLITCEHATNHIPKPYKHLIPPQVLNSHRGIDFGAEEYARLFGRTHKSPPHLAKSSRLLVDFNRSLTNNRKLFSEFTRKLPQTEKNKILETCYLPYRLPVEKQIKKWTAQGFLVLHISAHSFTAVLYNKVRQTDIGFLYDPHRKGEVEIVKRWKEALIKDKSGFKIRCNYPYKGIDDGFTAYLRRQFSASEYIGIELEVNQKFPLKQKKAWEKLKQTLNRTLGQLI